MVSHRPQYTNTRAAMILLHGFKAFPAHRQCGLPLCCSLHCPSVHSQGGKLRVPPCFQVGFLSFSQYGPSTSVQPLSSRLTLHRPHIPFPSPCTIIFCTSTTDYHTFSSFHHPASSITLLSSIPSHIFILPLFFLPPLYPTPHSTLSFISLLLPSNRPFLYPHFLHPIIPTS
ncbi:hypothetical protein BDN70DRAFT_625985 [Pholiota conissans]|uniref:Uncharacterized protein n=1 Tax=Pholiota conissans TaxID=109636 RepID=A0A9P5YJ98_9AGAR|nr:hypothetical protein BDN70DRAFT_625985 [Pholiota conissans]